MTVKLAKLFGNSSTNNSNSSQHQQQPPPLPPPNPPTNTYNYYNQQLPQLQAKTQKPYNPYMMDDEDDNMSLYSTTASIMTSRDHPFNNSQRPLLADRKPQVVVKQSGNNGNKKKQLNSNQKHHQQQQQQHQYGEQQQQQKSYISPYVQQQKRDSAKGLHGFNDFDILSQQYNQHLQSSPHIGYPYGSPPSPTQTSCDFVFDTSATMATTTSIQNHPASMTRGGDSSSMERHKHHNQPTHLQQQPFASISTALTSTPRYGNISNYGSTSGVAAAPPPPTNNYYNAATSAALSRGGNSGSPYYDINEADYYGKSLRFEDDFCNRRNIDFAKCHTLDTPSTANSSHLHEGPFIFGIAPEHQTDFTRMPAGGRSFGDISEDSGITKDDDKYSTKGRQQISTSDTSSTSRDISSATTTTASNDGISESIGTDGSNSCRKGAAKFLLRKRKTKKSPKETKSLKSQEKPCVKCVVVGDCAVGKTNLILSYLENRFNTEHVPTASDIYNADVMVNDSPVHLTLCDTAGQDTLDPLRELCYPDSDVFLLCFSVAKPETFHAIKTKWAPKFAKTKASLMLVGTQADLRTNTNVLNKLQSNGEQPISYADAWDLATTIGAKYIETSSATQDKVKEVFDTAIWEGLAPSILPPTPAPLWKRLFCLA
ncbi:myb-like protein Q isoform X2 [Musca domestica]|uniref:Myb-like protein Q isoform X2 n=1 Tax=Musca domestica TaxID=7370 RepID=A0A1I8MSA6_MUSDO|nr:myb-like protein Q isoform X2 [Musca domestica]